MMKLLKKIGLILFLSLFFINNGCKKEKCGCEGEAVFELTGVAGYFNYNEETKFASFSDADSQNSYYSAQFTICDPYDVWDMITQYPMEKQVLVWGRVSDDCMKQMSYMYNNLYVLRVDSVALDPINNK